MRAPKREFKKYVIRSKYVNRLLDVDNSKGLSQNFWAKSFVSKGLTQSKLHKLVSSNI